MTDVFSKEKRSWIMSRIRGKDTKIEKLFESWLKEEKIKFSKHYKMVGNPDFALPRKKVAIFVDGDFWHGYDFKKREKKLPKYWVNKIRRNMKRDKKAEKELNKLGWKVVRIWEHRLLKAKNLKNLLPYSLLKRKMTETEERLETARKEINKSLTKVSKNISSISLDTLEEGTMNPYLIKGVGLTINEAIEFYVWQRAGRSITTSFGSIIEKSIRILSGAKKSKWWDIETVNNEYASIKSGPRDMDKDQVEHFPDRAKKLKKIKRNATPLIILAYGKTPFGVMTQTLKNEGLNPDKIIVMGLRKVFKKLCNDPSLADKLIKILEHEYIQIFGKNSLYSVIKSKISELESEANKKYNNIDDLVEDMMGSS